MGPLPQRMCHRETLCTITIKDIGDLMVKLLVVSKYMHCTTGQAYLCMYIPAILNHSLQVTENRTLIQGRQDETLPEQ